MHNTSLSGLLRGAQTRHDDCGISWQSHKLPVENCEKNDRLMKLAAELIGAALSATRAKKEWLDIIARESERLQND